MFRTKQIEFINYNNMKKIVYFAFIIACLAACSKKEEPQPNHNINASAKENFTNPLKQSKNIQVDDYIPYILTIDDTRNDENAEYRLTPIREGIDFHQNFGIDFNLYQKEGDTSPNTENKYISFNQKGTHTFYIRPLVSGTFKLTFELRKFINGTPVGNVSKLKITFNAVKINIATEKKTNTENGTSRDYFSYYITIDDGNESTDTYLDAINMIQYCTVTYIREGREYNSDKKTILPKQKFEYYRLNGATSADINSVPVYKIKITQFFSKTSQSEFEYYYSK